MTEKTALITGVTGQDGALLAELLLRKGYTVHGVRRRSSVSNTERLNHLLTDENPFAARFHLHYGDMTDSDSLVRALQASEPDEVYNLAAQSHVQVSFETMGNTAEVNAVGVARLLEAIRSLGLTERTRFYQASTSELFGNSPPPQNEQTPFAPRSPYAISKLYGYWITVNARTTYGLHASNGILFNHEGPTRGESFVTRKITRAAAAIEAGIQQILELGNLDALRDWGHARDYVEGMWRIVQQEQPGDYVLATGETHTVREFTELAFQHIGVKLAWSGSGVAEVGVDAATGITRVQVNDRFFRPTEVNHLAGDASKAEADLGWTSTVSFEELVADMVKSDRDRVRPSRVARSD